MSLGRKKEPRVVLREHSLGSEEPAQETEEQWAERPLPGPQLPHMLSHGGGVSLLTTFSSLIYDMGTVGSAHPCQGAQS